VLETVEIETTEGKTRAAMPAIEPGALSIVDVEVGNTPPFEVLEFKLPEELENSPYGRESENFAATYPIPPPSTPATRVMARRRRTGSRVDFGGSTFLDEIGSKRAG
jgi:hypothetical protein